MKKKILAFVLSALVFTLNSVPSYANPCPVRSERSHYFDMERNLNAGYSENLGYHTYSTGYDAILKRYLYKSDCMMYKTYEYWQTYCICGEPGSTYTKEYTRHSICHD